MSWSKSYLFVSLFSSNARFQAGMLALLCISSEVLPYKEYYKINKKLYYGSKSFY